MDSQTRAAIQQFTIVLQAERNLRKAHSDLEYQVRSLSHEQRGEYARATTTIQERRDAWD